MNIDMIIKGLIIILILHIIILNINYTYDIGIKKNIEKFNNPSNEETIKFLTSTNTDDEFKKKLMKYIQTDELPKKTEFEEKNINKVMASNTFLNDNNVPNFESNVADVSKFYKVNYDNLDENNLKETSLENLGRQQELTVSSNVTQQFTNDIEHNGRKSTVNPDNWSYKNELPMNGGSMNGVVGYDSLESQYSMFNSNQLNIQKSDSNNFNNIPHDDLRKPIVYEN
jgi:hypothetical protein